MTEDRIARINELYHLSQKRALTEEEKKEQATLRKEYIDAYKQSLINQLDHTFIVDEKGNKHPLRKKDASN
ncbi:MAG: DUF896 domain-containing protein [Clostridia bacterium]|nr:DUF896 domain-containing protein [Clostridia bacterium]